MRTHITIKEAAMPSTVNGIYTDLVVPVSQLQLARSVSEAKDPAYLVSTDRFNGYIISKDEYYRLKRLLTTPIENLDGELA